MQSGLATMQVSGKVSPKTNSYLPYEHATGHLHMLFTTALFTMAKSQNLPRSPSILARIRKSGVQTYICYP